MAIFGLSQAPAGIKECSCGVARTRLSFSSAGLGIDDDATAYLPGGKDTETMMYHYLIMLLSTDWFFPFWPEIGLDLDQAVKTDMQQGCREIMRAAIVKNSVDDEGEFDYIDWTQEAESRARSMLLDLIDRLGAKGKASSVLQEWNGWGDDGLRSALMLRMLNHELIEGLSTEGSPVPDFSIRVAVMETSVVYDLDPSQFEEIARKSASSWDKYVQSLFLLDEMPTALRMSQIPLEV